MKRQRIAYDPLTGTFTRDGKPVRMWLNGWGHPAFRHNGATVIAARAAWALHTGRLPHTDECVIPEDGDHTNLKFTNLLCVHRRVIRHQQKTPSHNTSGHRNVSWVAKEQKWRVRVKAGGVSYNFGFYTDITDAVAAAKAARQTLHGRFAATT